MKIKHIVFFVLAALLFTGFSAHAQTSAEYFNKAARQYVNSDIPGAGQVLAEGLQRYPNDPKLNALNEKLKKDQEEQKQDQQNQDQQDQQNPQDQQQQDSDQKKESEENQEKRGEKSNQEQPSEEPSELESDLSEREKAMEEMKQRLQDMNISPEQAAQILDAMNNAELRYIQQNQKKPTKRPDRSKPDW